MDHNPNLARPRQANDDKGSEASIEHPDKVENICWQTRPAPPTAAENALADALQAIFGDDIHELPQIVERLNRARLAAPDGAPAWTEASLRAELRRLGH
jgi:hypothetical protein